MHASCYMGRFHHSIATPINYQLCPRDGLGHDEYKATAFAMFSLSCLYIVSIGIPYTEMLFIPLVGSELKFDSEQFDGWIRENSSNAARTKDTLLKSP